MSLLHEELTLAPIHRHELSERLLRSAYTLRIALPATDRKGRAAVDEIVKVANTLVAKPLPDLAIDV